MSRRAEAGSRVRLSDLRGRAACLTSGRHGDGCAGSTMDRGEKPGQLEAVPFSSGQLKTPEGDGDNAMLDLVIRGGQVVTPQGLGAWRA